MTTYYDVFVRDWWRKDEHGRIVPYPGAPRVYLAHGVTEEEARERCAIHRADHEPGWRSRKADYEEA